MNLLYWGRATVIYPLCNSNQYVLSPHVPNHTSPVLTEKFAEQFPGLNLMEYLQLFSQPNSISQAMPTLATTEDHQDMCR